LNPWAVLIALGVRFVYLPPHKKGIQYGKYGKTRNKRL